MNIVRYEPLEVLKDMNRLFDRVLKPSQQEEGSELEATHWLPSVDVREEQDHYLLKADLPGVDPEKTQVFMDQGALVIKGERSEKHEEKEDHYTRLERIQGSFYRRFTLPENIDTDNIEAEMDHGVLTVTVPKKEKTGGAKTIKVKRK